MHIYRYGLWLLLPILLSLPPVGAGESLVTESVAYAAEPLGVARVHFNVPDPREIRPGDLRFSLAGDHGNVLYPVFLPDPTPVGPRGPVAVPRGFSLFFLFAGREPVEVTATSNLSRNRYREFHARVQPIPDSPEGGRRRELEQWWTACREALQAARTGGGHYPVIENYLSWHLPRLLDLPVEPLESSGPVNFLSVFPQVERLIDLFVGTESIRIALQRQTLLDGDEEERARPTVPLPAPPAIRPVEIPPHEEGVTVEPLARLVPRECLYIRFPRYRDFQSLRRRAETWGGNLHDLILGRSFDSAARETLLGQLALKETALSALFGDLAIGEMALVARDTFVREGSALGIIFEAKNEAIFTASIRNMREETVALSRDRPDGPASEEEVTIEGQPVKFLRAPGNRIRSYHAISGRFHLFTNCRHLCERFLALSGGAKDSLAEDPGFLHARSLHPLDLPQTALVFISDPFLRELVGPAYRAEMTRRTHARAAMELVEVARRVAHAETGKTPGLKQLIAGGFLPAGIERQPDGSMLVEKNGTVSDSLRGYRGTFLPIPDVGVTKLTPLEARAYQDFARFYRRQWGRVDPVVIRIWLEDDARSESKTEKLNLVTDILPFARRPYQLLQAALGSPGTTSWIPPGEELLSVEAHLGTLISPRPFWAKAGFLDCEGKVSLEDGLEEYFFSPHHLPAYLILPITSRLPGGGILTLFLSTIPTNDGFQRTQGEFYGETLWGKESGDWIVLSLRKETAARAAESMRFRDGTRAQVRLKLHSAGSRRISPSLRTEAFRRTREAALSGAAFLSTLHGILKIPRLECEKEARQILAASVTCPAGGRYVSVPYPIGGGLFFRSDAFPGEGKTRRQQIHEAENFSHPLLDRLQDLQVSLTLKRQSLHSEVSILLMREGPAESND